MDAKILPVILVVATALLGGLIIVLVESWVARRQRRQLTAAGLYPSPGTETDEDVQRLLSAGYQDMAARCYQAVHRVNYQQARERLGITATGGYGFQFFALALGLGFGVAVKNIPLGAALGILFGLILGAFARGRRPR